MPPDGRCLVEGAACTHGGECCTGACTDGRCGYGCAGLEDGCDPDFPCCAGLWCGAWGGCCAAEGAGCAFDIDCCSNNCQQGTCATPPDAGSSDRCAYQNGGCDVSAVCSSSSDQMFVTCTCPDGMIGDGLYCASADGETPARVGDCGARQPSIQRDEDAGMVVVPEGPFWRGCNYAIDTLCTGDEFPGRCITLSSFEIDTTEVTQAAYQTCIAAGACTPPSDCGPAFVFNPSATPNLPMACVSWDQSGAFCQWAGKRLPTEAEWEKASRGTDGRLYPWGSGNPDGSPNPCAFANYSRCKAALQPVGSAACSVSPYGALDMSGNVWEWVSDWYDPGYYAVSPDKDPQGPAMNPPNVPNPGSFHVYRGGGITDPTTFQRSSNRYGGPPGVYSNVGLRCARSL